MKQVVFACDSLGLATTNFTGFLAPSTLACKCLAEGNETSQRVCCWKSSSTGHAVAIVTMTDQRWFPSQAPSAVFRQPQVSKLMFVLEWMARQTALERFRMPGALF